MDNVKPPSWFAAEVAALYLGYPTARPSAEVVATWWRSLAAYPQWAIVRAIRKAAWSVENPQYAPSCEAVRRHAEVEIKTPPATERQMLPPASAPESVDGRSLPEDNPYMRLARSWEQQSLALGLHPERPCPAEAGAARMVELMDLLEKRPVGGQR